MSEPSFFELVAQECLLPSLRPAVLHMFTSFGRWYPRMSCLATYKDEIFYAFIYILELHYLRKYNSSFSANFYNLKYMETPILPPSTSSSTSTTPLLSAMGRGLAPLTSASRRRLLCLLVFIPYLRSKLLALYKRYTEEFDEQGFENPYRIPPLTTTNTTLSTNIAPSISTLVPVSGCMGDEDECYGCMCGCACSVVAGRMLQRNTSTFAEITPDNTEMATGDVDIENNPLTGENKGYQWQGSERLWRESEDREGLSSRRSRPHPLRSVPQSLNTRYTATSADPTTTTAHATEHYTASPPSASPLLHTHTDSPYALSAATPSTAPSSSTCSLSSPHALALLLTRSLARMRRHAINTNTQRAPSATSIPASASAPVAIPPATPSEDSVSISTSSHQCHCSCLSISPLDTGAALQLAKSLERVSQIEAAYADIEPVPGKPWGMYNSAQIRSGLLFRKKCQEIANIFRIRISEERVVRARGAEIAVNMSAGATGERRGVSAWYGVVPLWSYVCLCAYRVLSSLRPHRYTRSHSPEDTHVQTRARQSTQIHAHTFATAHTEQAPINMQRDSEGSGERGPDVGGGEKEYERNSCHEGGEGEVRQEHGGEWKEGRANDGVGECMMQRQRENAGVDHGVGKARGHDDAYESAGSVDQDSNIHTSIPTKTPRIVKKSVWESLLPYLPQATPGPIRRPPLPPHTPSFWHKCRHLLLSLGILVKYIMFGALPATFRSCTRKIPVILLKLSQYYCHYFPKMYTGVELVVLLYQLSSLLEYTPYWSPYLHIARVIITRMAPEDYQIHRNSTSSSSSPLPTAASASASAMGESRLPRTLHWYTRVWAWYRHALLSCAETIGAHFRWLVVVALLAFRYVEWLRGAGDTTAGNENGQGASSGNFEDFPIPDALAEDSAVGVFPAHEQSENSVSVTNISVNQSLSAVESPTHSIGLSSQNPKTPIYPLPRPGLCIICQRTLTTPAATSTGYIGCYGCLCQFVEEYGTCPATGIPMGVGQLRRVFMDDG